MSRVPPLVNGLESHAGHLRRAALASLAALCTLLHTAGLRAQSPAPSLDYLVFVAAEAADRISLVRFGPGGARIERDIPIGIMPTDPDGPHGLAVSPDRRFLYVSTAHGTPYGYLWKLDAETGKVVARVELGYFPATLDITPDGLFGLVANFNLHGDHVPSSVSVVDTDRLVEIARVRTCIMPHGSRLNAAGTKQYSVCMMDDQLVEIDTRSFAVSRHFAVGRESGGGDGPPPVAAANLGEHGTAVHGMPSCSPTWAEPSPDGAKIYVACNKSNEIVEIDAAAWRLDRRIPAGDGVYNLDVTADGTLLIGTNKRGRSVSLIDRRTGVELSRIPTIRKVVHGVAVSPDDRYAFISVEGIGSEPGTVEVIDLTARRRVASVDVGQMAGGIAVWRTEPAR